MGSEEPPKPTPGDPDSARVVGMVCGRESRDGRLRVRCDPQIKLPSENPPTMPSREESN